MEVGTCDVIIKVTISDRPLLYTNKRDRTLFGTNDESGESMLADPWGYLYRPESHCLHHSTGPNNTLFFRRLR